jgi:IS5 family transposase
MAEMDAVVQWGALRALIEPVHPRADGVGRSPVGSERMLRIHFLQRGST